METVWNLLEYIVTCWKTSYTSERGEVFDEKVFILFLLSPVYCTSFRRVTMNNATTQSSSSVPRERLESVTTFVQDLHKFFQEGLKKGFSWIYKDSRQGGNQNPRDLCCSC